MQHWIYIFCHTAKRHIYIYKKINILSLLPLPLNIFQVTQQDFMVDSSSEVSWFEEVYTVQVRDVHSSLVGWWTVWAVLLHMHAEKTHFCPVYVFECKKSFQSVREGLGHLSTVNKPEKRKQEERAKRTGHGGFFNEGASSEAHRLHFNEQQNDNSLIKVAVMPHANNIHTDSNTIWTHGPLVLR